MERTINFVLMADEQFDAIITIKVDFSYTNNRKRFYIPPYIDENTVSAGGYWEDISKTSSIDMLNVSIEVISASSSSSTTLEVFNFNEASVKGGCEYLTELFGLIYGTRIKEVINDDGNENTDGYSKMFNKGSYYDFGIDRWVAESAAAKYAKDPKTGVGFFSLNWCNSSFHNYVVGPWGIAPASSKTDIGNNEQVSTLMSI